MKRLFAVDKSGGYWTEVDSQSDKLQDIIRRLYEMGATGEDAECFKWRGIDIQLMSERKEKCHGI